VLKDRIAIAKSEPEDQDCNAQSASTASEGTDILIILAGSIRVVLQIFLKRRSRFEGLDGEDYNGMGARSARLSLCYVVVLILGDLAARTFCVFFADDSAVNRIGMAPWPHGPMASRYAGTCDHHTWCYPFCNLPYSLHVSASQPANLMNCRSMVLINAGHKSHRQNSFLDLLPVWTRHRFVYAETLKPDLGGLFWQLGEGTAGWTACFGNLS